MLIEMFDRVNIGLEFFPYVYPENYFGHHGDDVMIMWLVATRLVPIGPDKELFCCIQIAPECIT